MLGAIPAALQRQRSAAGAQCPNRRIASRPVTLISRCFLSTYRPCESWGCIVSGHFSHLFATSVSRWRESDGSSSAHRLAWTLKRSLRVWFAFCPILKGKPSRAAIGLSEPALSGFHSKSRPTSKGRSTASHCSRNRSTEKAPSKAACSVRL